MADKILIVDDSLMDRKLLLNMLKKAEVDNEIIQATNGEEGLKLLIEHADDIRLILLDWQMPAVDGIGFMRAVRSDAELCHVPIIMISASSSEENKNFAKEVNPDLKAYIVKPYTPDVLINAVKRYV